MCGTYTPPGLDCGDAAEEMDYTDEEGEDKQSDVVQRLKRGKKRKIEQSIEQAQGLRLDLAKMMDVESAKSVLLVYCISASTFVDLLYLCEYLFIYRFSVV